MLDVGKVGHAIEQREASRVLQRGAREINELGVDVVRRHRGADAVEPGAVTLVLHCRILR